MAELSTSERLRQAQAKAKALLATRERIAGDIRVEEAKLKQTYDNLRELGIDDAENLTSKELQALSEKCQQALASKLESIELQLVKGDELLQKYNEIQQEN
jgi:hypothetical protein